MEKSSSIKEVDYLLDNITCCYTTVNGGHSKGNYASFNLGLHVDDSAIDVLNNRKELTSYLNKKIVWMNQTHSNTVLYVDSSDVNENDLSSDLSKPNLGVLADGIVTDDQKVALAVLTADCLPLVLVTEDRKYCAAIHCGWRGIFSGIIDKAINLIREKNTSELYAFIGPHIHQNSYEVGEDLLTNFVSVLGEDAKDAFEKKDNSKYFCSLEKLVRINLNKLDVSKIESCNIDTYTDKSYFSYRRNHVTGRLATLISLS